MNNITNYSTAQLVAEADRRGVPVPANLRAETPPVGFTEATYLDCAVECGDIPGECEPYGSCDCDRSIEYHGPNANGKTFSGITSQWTPKLGIFFLIQKHDSPVWSEKQLSELSSVIDAIKYKIHYTAAKDFFERHPEHFDHVTGVGALAVLADQNNLSAPEAFQAYIDIYKKREADNA